MEKLVNYLSYGSQIIDEEDIQEVVQTLRSSFLTQGPKIDEFEKAVADYVGAKYAVAFSNGTAALHGACYAAGISQGDEVITSPNTFAASANCVRYVGGTVVFADIDQFTYNIDPDEIEKKITPKTKAIIAVDFSGQPANMEAINKIAQTHNLCVIEDGAHSLGAEYKGQKVGTLADMTMFSFHPVKPITSAEGGLIITDSEEYYQKLRLFRSHGIEKTPHSIEVGEWYYEMKDLGYNYRMTDLQAALGLSQLKKIDKFLARRREIAELYNKAFEHIPEITVPNQLEDALSGWHLYMIQLDGSLCRKEIFEKMRDLNIGVHVHYIPVYWHPYYKQLGYEKGLCPKAEKYYQHALTLPIHPKMTNEQIEVITANLLEIVESYQK